MITNIDKMREFCFFWLGSLGNRFKDQNQSYEISVPTALNDTDYIITTNKSVYTYTSSSNATITEIIEGLQTIIDDDMIFTTSIENDTLSIIDGYGYYFDCTVSDNLICDNGNGVIVIEGYNNAKKDEELSNYKPPYPFLTFRISTVEADGKDVKWEENDTYRLHQTMNVDINVYSEVDHLSIMSYISIGLSFEDIKSKMSNLDTGIRGDLPDATDLSGILGGRSEKRANANFRFGTVITIENSGIAGLVVDPIDEVVMNTKVTSNNGVYENIITVDKETP